jgi:hypothetical protein
MMRFVVVPRGRGYWIDMTTEKSAPQPVERYNTAEEAIERRRALQQRADDIVNRKLLATGE